MPEMSEELRFDVFLSHSSEDKPVVRALAKRLRKDGLKVWFDQWEIKPGDNIPAKIEEGLKHSRVLLLCISAHAFGSDWAQLEGSTFRFRDPLNKERRFIPLRLDDARIMGSLAQFRYIDWRPAVRVREYGKLLEACRHPTKWPRPRKKKGDRRCCPRRANSRGLERLHTDGLERTEVLQAISEFRRAVWDYRDSLEWVQRLSAEAKSAESDGASPSRSEIREYCGNRNVNAWQGAAATLPIILRAREHLGIATDEFKNVIAHCPHSPEWIQSIEDLVERVESRLTRQCDDLP
jgi:hypothetical protein